MTENQDIQRKASIRAEEYHKALTPVRAYEQARDEAIRLFCSSDGCEIKGDCAKILATFENDYVQAVEAIAFRIEVLLSKGAK